jgi:hypothetical protein
VKLKETTHVIRGEKLSVGAILQQQLLHPQNLQDELLGLRCKLISLKLGQLVTLDNIRQNGIEAVENGRPGVQVTSRESPKIEEAERRDELLV